MQPMIRLPLSVVTVTCKLDAKREQCRYLGFGERSDDIFYCLKLRFEKDLLDGEISAISSKSKNSDKDPEFPMGDNCPGFRSEDYQEAT